MEQVYAIQWQSLHHLQPRLLLIMLITWMKGLPVVIKVLSPILFSAIILVLYYDDVFLPKF
jgi:hypothetical protein